MRKRGRRRHSLYFVIMSLVLQLLVRHLFCSASESRAKDTSTTTGANFSIDIKKSSEGETSSSSHPDSTTGSILSSFNWVFFSFLPLFVTLFVPSFCWLHPSILLFLFSHQKQQVSLQRTRSSTEDKKFFGSERQKIKRDNSLWIRRSHPSKWLREERNKRVDKELYIL